MKVMLAEGGGAGGWGGASKRHAILSGTGRQNKVSFFNVVSCLVCMCVCVCLCVCVLCVCVCVCVCVLDECVG